MEISSLAVAGSAKAFAVRRQLLRDVEREQKEKQRISAALFAYSNIFR
jgi:hypothetical protein